VEALFDFLGVKLHQPQAILAGRQNKNWRPTVITDEDRRQFGEVVREIPASYLDIFRREPYTSLPWIAELQRSPRDPL
jgi:hypothetical protein